MIMRHGWPALLALMLLTSCTHHPRTVPVLHNGNGAISGRLFDTDDRPFDWQAVGLSGPGALRIELLSTSRGVIATAHPLRDQPTFLFDDVPPGRYELAAYGAVPGEKTIAGNQFVSVNAGEIARVKLPVQVTSVTP